ncbi:hypothetical protein [Streptomyces similanensis]|uniref:Uncharacterized protein n=1 Tax=Streptomyces similanensis TaxID=1274988 RepID=A0ABP9LB76_9ACTN
MPGQRKRGRARERAAARRPAAGKELGTALGAELGTELGAGRWEVVLETEDRARLRDRLRELGAGGAGFDPAAVRVDTLCGRLARPTVHRLSVFVPEDAGGRAATA